MTVLQRLLEADLVEIDDDAQMAKLTAAASIVEKQLADGKLAPAPATLVAMDPQIPPDEPVLDAVYAAVLDQWPTVRKRHPDRPVALLRGVLAQALVTSAQADPVAAVIWATASSYAPYAPLAREQELWAAILAPIGNKAEKAAAAAWANGHTDNGIEFPAPELPPLSASGSPKVDSERLKGYLAAAAGPISKPPQGVTSNNHSVQQSYGTAADPTWADAFGTTAAVGISLAVNSALEASSKNIDLTPMSRALGEYSKALAGVVTGALQPLYAIELRSRVLLWRAALYSSSQQKAYRDLSSEFAVVAIAADLAAEVPPMSPASIDHLVWEAAHAVFGDEATTLSRFAEAVTEMEASLLGTKAAEPGRKTLLAFVRAVAASGEIPLDIREQTGLTADTGIKLSDLARWLFRDLRAERMVTVPARSRGRRR